MAARIEKTKIIIDKETGLNDIFYDNFSKNSSTDNSTIKNFDELNILTDYLIKTTEDQDLNMGLNIIKTLIFHPRQDVVASTLGKLYFIFDDQQIHELIIKKLKNMRIDSDHNIQKYVDESMEAIAGEVNNIEMFKLECNVFNNLIDKFELYLHSMWNRVPHHFDNKFRSKFENSRLAVSFDDMIFNLVKILMVVENDLDLENSMDNLYEPFEHDIIPFIEIKDVDKNKKNDFNHLIDVYALTFREKGHLNHLMSLLDDEDPDLRHMGVDGLIYVLKVLTNYEENVPFETIISEVLNHHWFPNQYQGQLNE